MRIGMLWISEGRNSKIAELPRNADEARIVLSAYHSVSSCRALQTSYVVAMSF